MDRRGRENLPVTPGAGNSVKRLLGWKAIGQFLGCTERTARRWEATRSMPVHRVPGRSRGSVWAAPEELTRWLTSLPVAEQAEFRSEAQADAQQQAPEAAAIPEAAGEPGSNIAPATDAELPAAVAAPGKPATVSRQRLRAFAVGAGLLLAVGGASLWLKHGASLGSADTAGTAATPYDDDVAARDEYRSARFELATRSVASLDAAMIAFRHLTERYPERAAGWTGLADTYLLSREFGSTSDSDAYSAAAHAAHTAIALDPKSPDAWLDIGFVSFWSDGNTEAALQAFQTGLQLNPSLARGWLWYGNALASARRFDDALRALARARTLDPESRAIVADESWTLFLAGRRDEGLATMERFARIDPQFLSWHVYLQRSYLVLGRDEDFLREASATAELRGKPDAAAHWRVVAEKYRSGGRAGMLDQLTADAVEAWQAGQGSAVTIALYRAQAKDRAGVVRWLRVAAAQRDSSLVGVAAAPEFVDYWDDPVVTELLKLKN